MHQNSRVVVFRFNGRCFCCFTAAMLVSLGREPTWRLHTKLYRWNSFPNNAGMKNRTDLNLGEVLCLSIIYHTPDSWLNLLNGYEFYFRCKPPIKHIQFKTRPQKTMPYYQPKWPKSIPHLWRKRPKNHTFCWAACTYIAHIRDYPTQATSFPGLFPWLGAGRAREKALGTRLQLR